MYLARSALLLPILFIVIFGEDLLSKFHQNDYKLEYTRGECMWSDRAVFKYLTMVTFKYNRTYAATNITLEYQVDLGYDKLDILIQIYKFASNEYRIFPIRFRLNYCLVIANNAFGIRNTSQSREAPACPIKKDTVYYTRNFHPDESQFPPLIPSGQYKLEMTFMIGNKEVALQNYYGVVYRPIKIPK